MKVLDLFSGIGGFSEGIRQAGGQIDWHGFAKVQVPRKCSFSAGSKGSNGKTNKGDPKWKSIETLCRYHQ